MCLRLLGVRIYRCGTISVRCNGHLVFSILDKEEDVQMLGLIAAVLIVMWLLGFFAFHVGAGLVHILLIIGIVLLVLHFARGARTV
jgi:hypothetical protein